MFLRQCPRVREKEPGAGGKGNIHRLQLQRSAFIAVPSKVRTLKPVSWMIFKAISDFRIL